MNQASTIKTLPLSDDQKNLILAAVGDSTFGVTVADAGMPDLPLFYANDAFLKMTGYSAQEVLGRNCRFLQGPDTDPSSVSRIHNALVNEQAITVLLVNYRKDTSPFWNRLQLSPIHNDLGDLIAYMSIQIDVSQDIAYTEIERERQKMETLGQLAGGVAHELNNALQPIILMADLIDEGLSEDRDQLQGCVDSILEHAHFAKDVVAGILSFAREEKSKIDIFEVQPLIDDVLKFASDLVPPTITLASSGTIGAPETDKIYVEINQTEFTQVFINLLKNAADAMDGKGEIGFEQALVTFDIETAEKKSLKPGRYVKFSVSDHGNGILAADLARVFQPFYTTKPPGEGTGLGLSMAYSIVQSWGGSISVRSDEGTVFTVLIPVSENPNLLLLNTAN